MNWLLEWSDSELAAIERVGPDLCLRLAAASLWRGGERRFASGLLLVLEGAEAADCSEYGALDSGALIWQGRRLSRLPLQDLQGELAIELQFRRGPFWRAVAQGLRVAGSARLHEDLRC